MEENTASWPPENYIFEGNPYAEKAERKIMRAEVTGEPVSAELQAALIIAAEIRTGFSNVIAALVQAAHEVATTETEDEPPVMPEVVDPASAQFVDHVEHLASMLWQTDLTNRSPARSFSEDYEAIQDRYRDQARAILVPGERDQR